MSDSVIEALRAAWSAQPEDAALALHLGRLVLDAGEAQEALSLAQSVLARSPADLAALGLAQEAASACGDVSQAQQYGRLLSALGEKSPDAGAMDTQADSSSGPALTGVPPLQEKPRLRVVSGGKDEAVDVDDLDSELPTIGLDDVGGMAEVKRRLHLSFLGPLRQPELMRQFGKEVRGGLLLYGPPGCGKSFIARALAGELGARFISVGIADVLDMYVGESEKRLHELFESARRKGPSVLFFDELDALGQKRSQLRHSGMRTTVNQLLAELDGTQSENQQLFVLGATNHPWDIDSALRRPGRFDRVLAVMPPDESAREAILRYHLKDRPQDGIDFSALAKRTSMCSGADLRLLCESAVEQVLDEVLNGAPMRPVQMADLLRAAKDLRPSTHSWFETARNFAMFANEHGTYDELVDFMREHQL